jgi:hypothetical protein
MIPKTASAHSVAQPGLCGANAPREAFKHILSGSARRDHDGGGRVEDSIAAAN